METMTSDAKHYRLVCCLKALTHRAGVGRHTNIRLAQILQCVPDHWHLSDPIRVFFGRLSMLNWGLSASPPSVRERLSDCISQYLQSYYQFPFLNGEHRLLIPADKDSYFLTSRSRTQMLADS